MDMSVMDPSSKMTPLLVKMYDTQKLQSLAKDTNPEARAQLTDAVIELLDTELSAREDELITDVLMELVRQAESDLREALAERLSGMDNVPLRLILQLANDQISVANPILSKSIVLNDLDLIYIIKSNGAEHWQAIAKRPRMSDQIINILADTGEEGTMINLTENDRITLTDYALDVIATEACSNDRLAKPLLQREEVTLDIARRLYRSVGEALKDTIKDSFDVSLNDAVEEAIDDVVSEFVDVSSESNNFMPTKAMLSAAARYKEKNLLTMKMIMGSLRRGQIQSFVAQFSKLTEMPAETIIEMLTQKSGQGLAVSCKAFDIEKADFLSIFLLTNRLRNGQSMIELKEMNKATEYYDRVEKHIALGIVKNSSEDSGNA